MRTLTLAAAGIAACLIALPVSAQETATETPTEVPQETPKETTTAEEVPAAQETPQETASSRIQEIATPGGLTAWLVEEHAIPIVTVQIQFDGGARVDEPGKEGAVNLATALIEEGAGDMDNQDFAARLDDINSSIGFGASRDSFSVSVGSLSENIAETMDLLRIALTDPLFTDEAIERVREQILSGLRSAKKNPQSLAGKQWYAAMFGDASYATPVSGSIETVTALTRDDVLAAYDRMVATARMKIGVVGDIDAQTLAALLDDTFGTLAEGETLDKTPVTVRETGGLVVIEEDVPQSSVVLGHRGILRDDPDYIPAYVMNYVLGGGGLTSRLTDEVREKKGLAYSVYSYLYPLDRAGLYMGGVATANERVAESLELIQQEWARMADGGLTAEELEGAKKYLTGAFALRFDSNAKIASFLVGAQSADLPIDYIDTRNGEVEAVTLEDVARVAERLLQPENLFVVVVGKPENLKSADTLADGIGG